MFLVSLFKKNDYKYVHLFLSTFFCPTASLFILISTLCCFVYHGSMFPLRYGKRPCMPSSILIQFREGSPS